MKKQIIKKKAVSSKQDLKDKQLLFCIEYMVDLNATQAAIRAGYSKATAHSIGNENLIKPAIQNKISELKQKRSEKVEVSAESMLRLLKNFAYSDITDTLFCSPEELKQLPLEVRRLISSYKLTTRTTRQGKKVEVEKMVELKFVDKLKACDMINRHIGLYEKDNNQQGGNDIDLSKLSDEELIAFKELMIKAKTDKDV